MGSSSRSVAAAFCVLLLGVLGPFHARAQQSAQPKRILALYWYNKDFPGNMRFDQSFQDELRRRAGANVEYYSEYLEENRFPGENQSAFLRDFLRQKYAGRALDVVVTNTPPTLKFLFDNRDVLFARVPIVFGSTDPPRPEDLKKGAGATGVLFGLSHRQTLELALRLHPDTEQVFVVSGSVEGDRVYETTARQEFQDFASRVKFTYLTNLSLKELIESLRSLRQHSIVFYVRQRVLDRKGGIVESTDVLSLIARQCPVPIYGMSEAHIGLGVLGGYVWSAEANAVRLADLALRVANGARPADIPLVRAPEAPMFDWRELQRFEIPEKLLPSGSVIRFRDLSMWQRYKWRIVGLVSVFFLQAALIAALLVARRWARKSRLELEEYKNRLEQIVAERTAELVEARDHALAASRSKSAFLAHISHELRTPLNAILGFTGLMLGRPNLSDQDRSDLTLVGASGEHLLALIDEVLDMAKIETGRAQLDLQATDLHALLQETVAILRGRAQAKNLQLLLETSAAVPRYIRTDPGKLRQVLTNLIGNAIKYTDVGSIAVSVACRAGDASGRPLLVIDVEDTGIGIGPEDQARVFDPFVQAAKASHGKGTGLGLSITRNFVQLLGGSITLDSATGRGSRFTVELPAQISEAVEPARPRIAGEALSLEPGQPQWRVLIVEDQKENWILLERLLTGAGFVVRVVEDGGLALDAFSSWRPHFIWMDLRLPVLDGLEVARRIRRMDGGNEVKMVAVTASAFSSQRDEVLAAGFDGFLRKPYRPREIFDCMAQHLNARFICGPPPAAAVDHLQPPPSRQSIAALPHELRQELEHAVISLDSERIRRALARVALRDASLGTALRRLAESYAYTPILDALRLQASGHQRP